MDPRRSFLPSQRDSPDTDTSDNGVDGSRQIMRRPLGESTGNAQSHGLNHHGLCQSRMDLTPPLQSIPTPPILPTQSLTSTYGTSLRSHRALQRDVSQRESPMGYPRGSRNPFYAQKQFADYRSKVMQRELEKENPVWPLYLEDIFWDAMILVPQMGRHKFSSKGTLYGRNMIISEHLWWSHWREFPPADGEIIPQGKAREAPEQHPAYRKRKQVSSHIQVVKSFFVHHPLFHFFFPRDADDEDKRLPKEEERESFKNNRVLIALADGRIPEERPNYDYFSRLLAAESEVFLQPKQCWIYVSTAGATYDAKNNTAVTKDGKVLDGDDDYPHLSLNKEKEYKSLPRSGTEPTMLLHEYTKTLSQKESSSVKYKWESRFPELNDRLWRALDDHRPADEHTARCVMGPCDIFHLETVLDLNTSRFPECSLNATVQFNVCRSDLQNQEWFCRTTVVKPEALYSRGEESPEPEVRDKLERVSLYSHRMGCDRSRSCDCAGRGNQDTIEVPFPALSWANTLANLAPYVENEQAGRMQEMAAGGHPRTDRDCLSMPRKDSGELPAKPAKYNKKLPSPMELLQQVAMYQEIFSASHDGSTNKRIPTRRAALMWTFMPVHEKMNEKKKLVAVPPGTQWRFLSKHEPTSEYHQQRAYISGSPNGSRNSVQSPNPGYHQAINAQMQEHFGTAYDAPNIVLPEQHHAHLTGLNFLDSYSNGLATPPPTASLTSNYAHSLDSATVASTDSSHHQIPFIPEPAGNDTQASSLVADHTTHSFLSGLGIGPSAYEESECDPGLPSWDGNPGPIHPQWPTSYVDSHHSSGGVSWADAAASMVATAVTTESRDSPLHWPPSAAVPHNMTTAASMHWADDRHDDGLWPSTALTPTASSTHPLTTTHPHALHHPPSHHASQPPHHPLHHALHHSDLHVLSQAVPGITRGHHPAIAAADTVGWPAAHHDHRQPQQQQQQQWLVATEHSSHSRSHNRIVGRLDGRDDEEQERDDEDGDDNGLSGAGAQDYRVGDAEGVVGGTGLTPLKAALSAGTTARKRNRTVSGLEEDEDDLESYPHLAQMRKLTHLEELGGVGFL